MNLSLTAAVLAFYPLHPCCVLEKANLEVASQIVRVDGDPCIELRTITTNKPGGNQTLWVDPRRGFAIRRFTVTNVGECNQIDVKYRHDSSTGWIPTEWIVCSIASNNGSTLDAVRVNVTKAAPLDLVTELESAIELDQGVWVVDKITNTQYIVQTSGSKRMIEPSEFSWLPSYDELIASASGQVGLLVERKLNWEQYWRTARVFAYIGASAIFTGLVLNVWRRCRKIRQHP